MSKTESEIALKLALCHSIQLEEIERRLKKLEEKKK